MKVMWRKSAIESLLDLDKWRESVDLDSIAEHIMNNVELYFRQQDLSIHIPGRQVFIQKMPVELRMDLIAIGGSDPYKVFYRKSGESIELFLIRHPHQINL